MFKELGIIGLFTLPAVVYDPPIEEPLQCPQVINVRVTNKADIRYTTYEQCPIVDNEALC